MHKASLYKRSNGLQRRDAQQVIEEFSHVLQWRPDGGDSILDIGCGSGDVTIDFLLPIMPLNFERLVGVDLSDEMVNFARQHYPHKRISFDQFDLNADINKQFFGKTEPFDHIKSFYCLHWVQNQERAVKNMFQLLKPDGDMLSVFLAQNPIFEIYKQMSQSKKWAKYMTDVDHFISPYQYSKNPADQFGKLLYSCGFTGYSVEIREKFFIFEGIDLLKKSVKAVNPFIERIPMHDHDAFFDDYLNLVVKMHLSLDDVQANSKTCRFLTPYKLMIAYARKSPGEFSSAIKWRSNDSLLDIGCGSDYVTVDLVLPILPGNFERLVGCDLSREMVEYARDKYALPKVSFKEFNLAIDVEKQLSWKSEQFDHITSFYCIMWVRDQRTAVENLYKLLKPGGDLLVLFVAKHPVYEFYKKQSRDKRWADCMFDVDEVISPYQNLNDPVNKFKSLLEKCGFVDIKVDLQEKSYTFNGLDAVRGFLTSINPFVDRVPIEERQDYIEDLVERFLDANYNVGQNDENIKLAPPYSLIAAYARKDDSH